MVFNVFFSNIYFSGEIWTSDRNGKTSNTPWAWDNLITNTSKYIITLSDFHSTQDTPPFLTRTDVYEYFQSYADHFGLTGHIQYDTRVLKVRKTPDHSSTGQWEVFTCPTSQFHGRDKRCGLAVSKEDLNRCHKEVFDVVLVCSGCFKIPVYPEIPGLDSFPGIVRHSFDYKSGFVYEDKKVLVVGNSFSAGDVANDVSMYSKKVVDLTVGRGTWIAPRVHHGGLPTDRNPSRYQLYYETEENTNNKIIADCQSRLDHFASGINPDEPPTRSAFMLGDEIYLKILTDRVRIKDELLRFNGSTAEFKSGAKTCDIDAVIFCTGYKGDMSFVEDVNVSIDRGRMDLYNFMLPIEEKHHTLAFLGFLAGDGAPSQAIELQARYAARLITGKIAPPSKEAMKRNIETMKSFSYARKGKFSYQIPLLKLCDFIASEIGVYPRFWRVFWRDPILAFRLWSGPIFSAQYRLLGPDSDWKKARAACYRAHEVMTSNPTKRGKVTVRRDDVTDARRRRLILLTCGVSAVFAVGNVGVSRNWFQTITSKYFEF
ncbi:dimethylaniline monooxygenase [N-oxide-forming] [Elysia marginata]|uniref:Flavin-containing monooxygenase n=1 Tax=Elysia marginata TaxID=1093978 RepID=A0AAV4HIG1_9GAST|nr:dimethylaniline monooxygenase [N-oxide-forming] [Elysia marginata]